MVYLSRRFGVEQKGAVRPCDNGREAQQNAASSQHETITNTTAELPASIASLFFARLRDQCRLRGGSDDWRKAYRQCGARDPACQVVAVWDPYRRCVAYFVLHGMEFGQLPAVNNFNLVAKVMTRVARLLFAFCGGNYFDDYVVVEPDYAGSTAQECLLFLHHTCGFLLDKKKHEPMEPAFKFVGVMHDLSHAHLGRVSLLILEERAERVSAVCKRVRATKRIFAGQAASLRGKLYFSCTTAFGKVGRASLQPFVERQFHGRPSVDLTEDEDVALAFFIALLDNMPPRIVRLASPDDEPDILWTDASYESSVGKLGFVAFLPRLAGAESADALPDAIRHASLPFSGYVHSSSVLPRALHDLLVARKQQIGPCELIAGIAPYLTLPDLFRGRDVMHWIDNTGALSALIKGYSGKPDLARITSMFHMFNCGLQSRVYFEYVESKANVADLPSRDSFEFLNALRSVSVDMRLPSVDEWDASLSYWRDLATANTHVRTRARPRKRKRSMPSTIRAV